MEFNQDTLKDIATSCVKQYISDSVPLTTSITKIASDSELNPDQIKRVVETTNQLAYLSKLASADDRTEEFAVAEFSDVMSGIFQDVESFSKQASVASTIGDYFSAPIEKVASDKDPVMDKSEGMKALVKVASQSRRELGELDLRKQDLMVKIAQEIAQVKKDAKALEKIATLENAAELTKLAYGVDEVVETRSIFSDKDMEDVKSLSDTLLLAKEASESFKQLEPKVLQAEAMIKEAAIGPIIGATKGIFNKMPKSVQNMGSAAKAKMKKPIAVASAGIGALETADNVATTSAKTKRKSDVWSSLRG